MLWYVSYQDCTLISTHLRGWLASTIFTRKQSYSVSSRLACVLCLHNARWDRGGEQTSS